MLSCTLPSSHRGAEHIHHLDTTQRLTESWVLTIPPVICVSEVSYRTMEGHSCAPFPSATCVFNGLSCETLFADGQAMGLKPVRLIDMRLNCFGAICTISVSGLLFGLAREGRC